MTSIFSAADRFAGYTRYRRAGLAPLGDRRKHPDRTEWPDSL